MIVSEGKYYLYRHIRKDTNQPFYVGIGTKTKKDLVHSSYYRAHKKHARNPYWRNIIAKYDYEVEILLESNDYKFIQEKEKEFIALYGRKENSTGILSNMTDGGEGNTGIIFTDEYRKKISEGNKGKKRTKDTLITMSLSQKGKSRPYASDNAKKIGVYQFDLQGNKIAEFSSLKEACSNLGIKYDKYISKVCKGEKKSYRDFVWKFKI